MKKLWLVFLMANVCVAANFTPDRAKDVTVSTNAFNGTYVIILAPFTNGVGITAQEVFDNLWAGPTQHFHYGIFHNGLLVSNGITVRGGANITGGLTADTVTAGTGTFYQVNATNGDFSGTLTAQDMVISGNLSYSNSAVSNLFFGYPRVTITTNMFSSEWTGASGNVPITNATLLNAFDGSTGTWSSASVLSTTQAVYGTLRCSLGSRYRGVVYIEGDFTQTDNTGRSVLYIGGAPWHYGYTSYSVDPRPENYTLTLEDALANRRFCFAMAIDSSAEIYLVSRRCVDAHGITGTAKLRLSRFELYGVAVP